VGGGGEEESVACFISRLWFVWVNYAGEIRVEALRARWVGAMGMTSLPSQLAMRGFTYPYPALLSEWDGASPFASPSLPPSSDSLQGPHVRCTNRQEAYCASTTPYVPCRGASYLPPRRHFYTRRTSSIYKRAYSTCHCREDTTPDTTSTQLTQRNATHQGRFIILDFSFPATA
jgi:hypothetical protein